MADVMVYYVGGGDAKITGEVTDRVYWFREGRPTAIHSDDAELMLKMTVERACCGTKEQRTIHPFRTK